MEKSIIRGIRVETKAREIQRIFIFTCLFMAGFFTVGELWAQEDSGEPIRKTFDFGGIEREYFIHNPQELSSDKTYWLLVVVHGGGGNGRNYFLADGICGEVKRLGLNAIVVAPSFSNTDFLASRFPVLGEGAFLKQIIKELHGQFSLHKKILLTGYSRGGQFSHRFALRNPGLVKACAPFAAGTWTTPDGILLIESLEKIADPKVFLSTKKNAEMVPERLQNLFEPRVAKVAGLPAKSGSKKVPFLVMCGTMDPRLSIAKQFSASLKTEGYLVKTEWPKNPHGGRTEYSEEFRKYSKHAGEFFLHVTDNE